MGKSYTNFLDSFLEGMLGLLYNNVSLYVVLISNGHSNSYKISAVSQNTREIYLEYFRWRVSHYNISAFCTCLEKKLRPFSHQCEKSAMFTKFVHFFVFKLWASRQVDAARFVINLRCHENKNLIKFDAKLRYFSKTKNVQHQTKSITLLNLSLNIVYRLSNATYLYVVSSLYNPD